jgi:hypothetical protein
VLWAVTLRLIFRRDPDPNAHASLRDWCASHENLR